MYANYHTHTTRCNHATGTPREYIEAAIRNGTKILGFSDHVPYPFSNGFVSDLRMAVAETGDYIREMLALREEYADRIQLPVGYEAEFFPDDFDAMLENIRQYPCDYLILGQHYVGTEHTGHHSGTLFTDESILTGYVDQVCRGLDTGVFTYLAHPDVPWFEGDAAFYRREMARLCVYAADRKIPLEINMYGLAKKRNYPTDRFWQIAAEVGNDVVIGCDAHSPSMLENVPVEREALSIVEKHGLHLLETLELKPLR